MQRLDPDATRQAAERARAAAEDAHQNSEYPRYGRAVHNEKARALEELAETLEEVGPEPPASTGNAYADRLARRQWALKIRAARKRVESASLAAESHDMGSTRPMGQPLQGSPAHQRTQLRAIERMHRKDQRAHEAHKEAEALERRAASVGSGGISSDDPEAVDKLRAKLASLEAKRDAVKEARKPKTKRPPLLNYPLPDGEEFTTENRYHEGETYTLGQVAMSKAQYKQATRWSESGGTVLAADQTHRMRVCLARCVPDECRPEGFELPRGGFGHVVVFLTDSKEHKRPAAGGEVPKGRENAHNIPPAYVLTNLGAEIRRVKARIAEFEALDATPAAGGPLVELPGCTVEDWGPGSERCDFDRYAMVSDRKPPREITQGLRRLGLRWMRSESAWVAYRNNKGRHAIEQGAKLYSEWWQSAYCAEHGPRMKGGMCEGCETDRAR